MLIDLHEHPGLLYVVATLMPLVSFVLLLLAGALRAALRPTYTDEAGSWLFRLLGGRAPGRGAAYVATAAMAIAFVLSVFGFVLYRSDLAHTHGSLGSPAAVDPESHNHDAKEHDEKGHAEVSASEKQQEQFESQWSGRVNFVSVEKARGTDPTRGSVLQLGYHVDTLTTVMFLMVTLIATLIHIFSIGYMGDELQPVVEDHQVHTEHGHLHRRGRFGRFFMFLSLFCFSMLNLILADNLFQVFLSWELVGICSYLLIGFYYERTSASNAANKAFITNRIGDAGFILGLLILWTYVGTFNFQDLFARVRAPMKDAHGTPMTLAGQVVRADAEGDVDKGEQKMRISATGSDVILLPKHLHNKEFQPGETLDLQTDADKLEKGAQPPETARMPYWLLVAAGLGIFLGCVGKSAQFPLHVWLPDAMEGPTPVSALIHAATMVAAGVYLVGRVFPLFTSESRLVIAYTGAITLFVAATIAVVMTDIKKVLAYSTVSQLGYMMLALGVGGWVAGLFHLVTHAFFKALLFLGSGSVIYGCHHEQEMTKMGGLHSKMRITSWTMLIGVLTIAGIPLFSGWYSKDAILAQAMGFVRVHREHTLLFLLPLLTAGITAFYMARMWFMTFTGQPRDADVYEHAHESPRTMTIPLIVLAFFSVVVAWGWPVWDAEASLLEGHLHHSQYNSVRADFGHLEEADPTWEGEPVKVFHQSERYWASQYHSLAGNLALGIVLVAVVFSALIYYYKKLDPAEAAEQFPALHRFLWNKWYFDELYSGILVRPALVVAHWCRAFDARVIDGAVHLLARCTVGLSLRGVGRFDLGIVDGLVNLTGRVIYGIGDRLRTVQTGYIRSYVLFLVVAGIGIFVIVALALAR